MSWGIVAAVVLCVSQSVPAWSWVSSQKSGNAADDYRQAFEEIARLPPIPGGVSYKYNRTPPIINYNLKAKITHKSETTGYESKRYNMAAKDIAEQISKELAKNLKNWQEKHGLLPELPTSATLLQQNGRRLG